MDGKLLTFLLVVCSASHAGGIRCYMCSTNGACIGNEIGVLRSCPNGTRQGINLVANQCVTFEGEYSAVYQGQTVSVNLVYRNCNYLPGHYAAPPLRCLSVPEVNALYPGLLLSLLPEGAQIYNNVSLSGDSCFCDSDGCNGNGMDSVVPTSPPVAIDLQCYMCSNPGGVCTDGEMGELQSCPTRTILGVDYVANQCFEFDGEFSVTGQTVFASGVARGCNYLPANEGAPPLQCFSDTEASPYSQGLLTNLLPEGTPVLGNITVSISGALCFCDNDGCNGVDSLQPFLWLTLITTALTHLQLM